MEYVEDLDCDSDSSDAVNETLEHYARVALADFDDDDLYSTKRDRKKKMSDHQHDNFEMATDKVWSDLNMCLKVDLTTTEYRRFVDKRRKSSLQSAINKNRSLIREQQGQQQRRDELKQKMVKQRELAEELEQKVTRQKKGDQQKQKVLKSRKMERKPQLDLERRAE